MSCLIKLKDQHHNLTIKKLIYLSETFSVFNIKRLYENKCLGIPMTFVSIPKKASKFIVENVAHEQYSYEPSLSYEKHNICSNDSIKMITYIPLKMKYICEINRQSPMKKIKGNSLFRKENIL